MKMNEYQEAAGKTAVFPSDPSLEGVAIYPVLGLAGETGELVEKFKKGIRDGSFDRSGALKELGDVLWYVAAVATAMGVDLQSVAELNLIKLADRQKRKTLKGSGDNR